MSLYDLWGWQKLITQPKFELQNRPMTHSSHPKPSELHASQQQQVMEAWPRFLMNEGRNKRRCHVRRVDISNCALAFNLAKPKDVLATNTNTTRRRSYNLGERSMQGLRAAAARSTTMWAIPQHSKRVTEAESVIFNS